MLSGVAAVTAVAFLFSPAALGGEDPVWFVFAVRYGIPALLLGVLCAAIAAPSARGWLRWLPFGALGVALLTTEIDRSDYPEARERLADSTIWEPRLIASMTVVVGAIACVYLTYRWTRQQTRALRLTVAVVSALVLVALSLPLHDFYLDRRYADAQPLPSIYRWASAAQDERIGIVGFFVQYPLTGADFSNYVQYVGERAPRGAFNAPATCQSWRRMLNEGRYSYLVVAPLGFPVVRSRAREFDWTATDPAVDLEMTDGAAALFRVRGSLDPGECPSPSASSSPAGDDVLRPEKPVQPASP
jgi:hypothetical protein